MSDNGFSRDADAPSGRMLKSLVEKNADGIIVLSNEGVILYANPAAQLFLGRGDDDLVGAMFGEPLVPGEATEVDLLSSNGTRLTAEMRSTPIEWDGQSALLASFRDISARKQAEKDAAEAVRLRDQFLAMLSHELRNPMSAILAAAHLIENATSTQQARAAAEIIQRQGAHTARLLEDLLDVSRVTQGKIAIEREEVNVVRVMKDVLLQLRAAAAEKKMTIVENFSTDRIIASVDPTRIQQIFINLVQNAIKYSPEKCTVEVGIDIADDQFVLVVADNGDGIDPEVLPNIFQPFVQCDTTLARSAGGIGVGLTLVKKLVNLHDGVVTAKSNGLGEGTQFVVTIPLRAESESVEKTQTQNDQQAAERRPRVLLVEDLEDNRNMLARLLELEGYAVDTARNGGEAMMKIHNNKYDVALLEITLPVVNGLEVARQVRANHCYNNMLLLAVTGCALAEDRRKALRAGFDEHFVKPFTPETLTRYLAESGRPIPQHASESVR